MCLSITSACFLKEAFFIHAFYTQNIQQIATERNPPKSHTSPGHPHIWLDPCLPGLGEPGFRSRKVTLLGCSIDQAVELHVIEPWDPNHTALRQTSGCFLKPWGLNFSAQSCASHLFSVGPGQQAPHRSLIDVDLLSIYVVHICSSCFI